MELLKQPQYDPYPLDHQVMLIYAGTRGHLDKVPVDKVRHWKNDFLRYMDTSHANVGQSILNTNDFTDETEAALKQALTDFNAGWTE